MNHGTLTCAKKAHIRVESGGPRSGQHAEICGPKPPRRNWSTMKCSTIIYTIHIYEPRSGGLSGYHNAAVLGRDEPGLPTTGSGFQLGC